MLVHIVVVEVFELLPIYVFPLLIAFDILVLEILDGIVHGMVTCFANKHIAIVTDSLVKLGIASYVARINDSLTLTFDKIAERALIIFDMCVVVRGNLYCSVVANNSVLHKVRLNSVILAECGSAVLKIINNAAPDIQIGQVEVKAAVEGHSLKSSSHFFNEPYQI